MELYCVECLRLFQLIQIWILGRTLLCWLRSVFAKGTSGIPVVDDWFKSLWELAQCFWNVQEISLCSFDATALAALYQLSGNRNVQFVFFFFWPSSFCFVFFWSTVYELIYKFGIYSGYSCFFTDTFPILCFNLTIVEFIWVFFFSVIIFVSLFHCPYSLLCWINEIDDLWIWVWRISSSSSHAVPTSLSSVHVALLCSSDSFIVVQIADPGVCVTCCSD